MQEGAIGDEVLVYQITHVNTCTHLSCFYMQENNMMLMEMLSFINMNLIQCNALYFILVTEKGELFLQKLFVVIPEEEKQAQD